MNKLKTSTMSVILSALLVMGLPTAIDNPVTHPTDTHADEVTIEIPKQALMEQKLAKAEADKLLVEDIAKYREYKKEQERIKKEQEERERELASRKEQKTYLGEFTLTWYCGCSVCNGKAGKPCANGQMPKEGVTIAADTSKIPMNTKVYIEGIGDRVVMDTGSAIKSNKIDVFINDHQKALQLGRRKGVKVWKY